MIIFKKCLAGLIILLLVIFATYNIALTEEELSSPENEKEELATIVFQHLTDNYRHERDEVWKALAATICEESARYAVDYRMVMAIIKVESNFRPRAVSRDGSCGIMQLKPRLAREMARITKEPYRGRTDLFDPVKNVKWGVYHLSVLAKDFPSVEAILFAYNAGVTRARRVTARNSKPRTAFTRKVLREYGRYCSILPEAPTKTEEFDEALI